MKSYKNVYLVFALLFAMIIVNKVTKESKAKSAQTIKRSVNPCDDIELTKEEDMLCRNVWIWEAKRKND
jgi:hypothetical protein